MPIRFLLGAAILLAATAPGSADRNPIASLRWSKRVILVSAPSPDDPALARQRSLFKAMTPGVDDRDLALVEAVGDGGRARRLRETFGLDPAAFTVLLIGKDGGEKLRSTEPLGPDRLFPLIDAMPMRRSEIRRD